MAHNIKRPKIGRDLRYPRAVYIRPTSGPHIGSPLATSARSPHLRTRQARDDLRVGGSLNKGRNTTLELGIIEKGVLLNDVPGLNVWNLSIQIGVTLSTIGCTLEKVKTPTNNDKEMIGEFGG